MKDFRETFFLLLVKKLVVFLVPAILFSCSGGKTGIPVQEKDFCSEIHKSDSTTLSAELKPVEELMRDKTGVFVLEEGGGSLVTRAWLSEYAEKSIDIQYFIFSTDNVGLIACDYIVRAADRGVKVRILVDDLMVDAGPHEILTLDSHENISVKIYNPGINLGKNLFQKAARLQYDFYGANQRMHNKTFTVDGKVSITGGRNVADEYFDFDHEYNFRDRDVLLLGKCVANIQGSFEKFWNDSLSVDVTKVVALKNVDVTAKDRFDRLHRYACNPANFWPQIRERIRSVPATFKQLQQADQIVWTDSVEFVSDVPGKWSKEKKENPLSTAALMSLVQNAKVSVDIQSPYLVATETGLRLFRDAIKRGVKIRVLTNSLCSTDNLEAFAGYQGRRKELLDLGVRIFEFKPDAACRFKIMTSGLTDTLKISPIFGLHAKSMVVDGKIVVIGTFNLDPRSADVNTECIAIIRSKKVAEGVLKGMEEEFKEENSWETTKNFNPDSKAGLKKGMKAITRRIVPEKIL